MTAAAIWWPEPQAGVIVWCRFPDTPALRPGPRPRPALILTVFDDEAPQFRVRAAYGTSQKVDRLYAGEFHITPQDGAAFRLAGLSFPTKFNLSTAVELPYNTQWFDVPPTAPFGRTPQLGVLHANLMRRVTAAWQATHASRKR
ncbi:MAG: hypothetical protein ACRETD_05615 [Steroidobacteraceae bacterium]